MGQFCVIELVMVTTLSGRMSVGLRWPVPGIMNQRAREKVKLLSWRLMTVLRHGVAASLEPERTAAAALGRSNMGRRELK